MCRLSAVVMSMGSSFHHLGARTANSHDLDSEWLGVPRSEGAASRLADAEGNSQLLKLKCQKQDKIGQCKDLRTFYNCDG